MFPVWLSEVVSSPAGASHYLHSPFPRGHLFFPDDLILQPASLNNKAISYLITVLLSYLRQLALIP